MTGRKPTLYIVGDSTLSSFDDNYYIPRYGYGTQLHRYLGGINVVKLRIFRGTGIQYVKPSYSAVEYYYALFLTLRFFHIIRI